MGLTSEDALRINVLLAGSLEAVRIDESRMTLFALSEKGEARVPLNPNCRDESYLRQVRETLSSHVLGSPGGYPVYLKRWTRMGQARDEILESLLLLGEPEAVVAVVNAGGMTDELARRAWWTSQTSENARCMLRHQPVVEGAMGPVLAEFLVEFLPFEEEACNQIASVRMVLQRDLIPGPVRDRLWEKARHRNSFYVGFLQSVPDDLPDGAVANPVWEATVNRLAGLTGARNPYAVQLCRLLSPAGQAWLTTVEAVLGKPANQDVMVELLHAISAYFATVQGERQQPGEMQSVLGAADNLLAVAHTCTDGDMRELGELVRELPDGMHHVRAMLVLSMLGEAVLNPVFSRTDAIGTVMRKKLKPVTGPMLQQIDILRHE
jgi:hypothetical protein